MSALLRLLNPYLRLTEKTHMARAATPARLRRSFERKARMFFHGPRAVRTSIWAGEGLELSGPEDGPLIFYIHGGGFIFGSPETHRAMVARLCHMAGMRAVLPRYRLAPEYPFPAAQEDVMTAYRAVMDHPGGVFLGGDSAGGALALSLLAQITAEGLPQPLGTFAFSPLTDLSYSGASFTQNASSDVVLPAQRAGDMAEMFLSGHSPMDPRASPLFARFVGASPVWMTVGDTEILLDDTRRMTAHLRSEGVDVTTIIKPDHPHVWPLFHNILPEARTTLGEVVAWLTSRARR
ncbi:alpha/beta hydrolase [Roseovarius sp. LXJ103]|uniref:alpha/beta hydrolase n=1 Tax=Roseovarius carneus TaxID=2853164 RepID=UPI000D61BE33|nr:alpha/beta hydrolase [Roseovarius carneus]MBZ8118224.1 alpha/beta hydrolase [Roseovarius carneus]PWE36052.1 esterase [Pelagicola sp. LXJ1103]